MPPVIEASIGTKEQGTCPNTRVGGRVEVVFRAVFVKPDAKHSNSEDVTGDGKTDEDDGVSGFHHEALGKTLPAISARYITGRK